MGDLFNNATSFIANDDTAALRGEAGKAAVADGVEVAGIDGAHSHPNKDLAGHCLRLLCGYKLERIY